MACECRPCSRLRGAQRTSLSCRTIVACSYGLVTTRVSAGSSTEERSTSTRPRHLECVAKQLLMLPLALVFSVRLMLSALGCVPVCSKTLVLAASCCDGCDTRGRVIELSKDYSHTLKGPERLNRNWLTSANKGHLHVAGQHSMNNLLAALTAALSACTAQCPTAAKPYPPTVLQFV